MFHELIVRIAGVHIISAIYFLFPHADFSNDQVKVHMQLNNPATKEIISIVKSGFLFQIRLYGSITINQQRVIRFEKVKSLSYRDYLWFIGDSTVSSDSIQLGLGKFDAVVDRIHLSEGDKLLLFCSATILPDKDFEISTGLTTAILWNYYIPHIKVYGVIKDGKLVFEDK